MSFTRTGAFCVAAIGLAATSGAHAASGGKFNAESQVRPYVVAAGKTRVAAIITATGTTSLSKGVASITHLATGEYCVTLVSTINAATAVPVLTFDYNSSPDYAVFITYSPSLASSCAANSIAVITYTTDSGTHVLADEGFTFVVP